MAPKITEHLWWHGGGKLLLKVEHGLRTHRAGQDGGMLEFLQIKQVCSHICIDKSWPIYFNHVCLMQSLYLIMLKSQITDHHWQIISKSGDIGHPWYTPHIKNNHYCILFYACKILMFLPCIDINGISFTINHDNHFCP